MPSMPLEQRRAKFAYERVKAVKDRNEPKLEAEYLAVAREIPVLVLRNGLGQAVAFLQARRLKGKKAHGLALDAVADWLTREGGALHAGNGGLVERIVAAEQSAWVRAGDEAVAFSVWLKRMAEALLEKAETPHD